LKSYNTILDSQPWAPVSEFRRSLQSILSSKSSWTTTHRQRLNVQSNRFVMCRISHNDRSRSIDGGYGPNGTRRCLHVHVYYGCLACYLLYKVELSMVAVVQLQLSLFDWPAARGGVTFHKSGFENFDPLRLSCAAKAFHSHSGTDERTPGALHGSALYRKHKNIHPPVMKIGLAPRSSRSCFALFYCLLAS